MNRGTLDLALGALFIALVTVATVVISIPMIGTQGFVNVGDTMIFTAAALLGPRIGFIAGALGSTLADYLLGYAHWAPWTFIIKGIEGLIAGLIVYGTYHRSRSISPRTVLGLTAAATWMILGYFIAGSLMYGFAPALGSVPGNILQGGASIMLAVILLIALRKLDLGG